MLLIGVRTCHKYITSVASSCPCVTKRWLLLGSSLIKSCWTLWNVADQAMRTASAEENSLYRYKTRTHVINAEDSEDVEEGVVRQCFPLYDSEFEEQTMEAEDEGKMCEDMNGRGDEDMKGEGDVCQFTSEEMEEVCSLHRLLLATTTSANSPQHPLIIEKYAVAASLAGFVTHIPGIWNIIHVYTSHFKEGYIHSHKLLKQ